MMTFLCVRGAKLEPVRVKARRAVRVPELVKVGALAAAGALFLCGALVLGCAS